MVILISSWFFMSVWSIQYLVSGRKPVASQAEEGKHEPPSSHSPSSQLCSLLSQDCLEECGCRHWERPGNRIAQGAWETEGRHRVGLKRPEGLVVKQGGGKRVMGLQSFVRDRRGWKVRLPMGLGEHYFQKRTGRKNVMKRQHWSFLLHTNAAEC